MYRFALLLSLLLALSSPLSAQRFGVGYLNFGPVTRETVNHVRSGNMGLDYTLRVEAGENWTLGATYSPTHLYVWPKRAEGDISRWSFRPGVQSSAYSFAWLSVDAGRRFKVAPLLSVEPGVALWVPTATNYRGWGAQMGAAPALTLEARVGPRSLGLACRASAVFQRARTWTVLAVWARGESTEFTPFTSYPLSCALEVGNA